MSLILSFIETVFVFVIYNIIFNDSVSRKAWVFILIAFLAAAEYVFFTTVLDINKVVTFIFIIGSNGIITSIIEKKDTNDALIEIGISLIILSLCELIILLGLTIIFNNRDINDFTLLVILSGSMSLITIIIYKLLKKLKVDLRNKVSKYSNLNLIILNIFIFLTFIKVLGNNNLLNTEITLQIVILTIMIVIINIFYIIGINKKRRKDKKNEINENINPLIDELMKKMKANEHEYNNHLNVIYAMIQVCKEDELKIRAREYIGEITSYSYELGLLAEVENPIVKAILFNKLNEAKKHGIKLQYEVESDFRNIPLDDSELTVVLSNLINNAIEYTKKISDKDIDIYIGQVNDKHVIEISNAVVDVNKWDIKRICKEGFSTKGNGRGYGLSNVKSIIDKYKGKLNIELVGDRIVFMVNI